MSDAALDMPTHEVNFDGIVGVTHNQARLSLGQSAGLWDQNNLPNPKKAALQGLNKMYLLHKLGVKQAVLPPHERPSIKLLRRLGFSLAEQDVLAAAAKKDPVLLAACSQSSAMLAASSINVTPSADAHDGRVHFTPANLANKFYRSYERFVTFRVLKSLFNDEKHFMHHEPLPTGKTFSDEGLANQLRFCSDFGLRGFSLFVFGKHIFRQAMPKPKHTSARQTLEASQAIVRSHGLHSEQVMFAQQSPVSIDAGAFHVNMVTTHHKNVLMYHEQAFVDTQKVIGELVEKYKNLTGHSLTLIKIGVHEVTIQEAVRTNLFNGQLVSLDNGEMVLVVSVECEENRAVKKCIEKIVSQQQNPIKHVRYVDLKSVLGVKCGGPASLRAPIVLTNEELKSMNPSVLLTDALYNKLERWINKYYRDRLMFEDLADPQLLNESRTSLDELTQILKLGNVYDFQR